MLKKQTAAKPSLRIGTSVKTVLRAVLTASACVAAIFYISNTLSSVPAVSVSVNGEQVGYLRSQDDIAGIKTAVLQEIETASEGKYTADFDVTYDFVDVTSPDYITSDEYREYLWSLVDDDFTEAYMLYIDGHHALAAENGNELHALIEDIESDLFASCAPLFEDVRITNDWYIQKQLCLKSAVKPMSEINELINPLANTPELMKKDSEQDSVVKINALNALAPASLDNEVSDSTETENDLILDYTFVNTVTVDEVIYYETEYVDDPTNYIGYEYLLNDGSNGEKTVTYELIYDKTGQMIARNAIVETVTVPAVNKVISVGTMEIPDAVPTGTLIWPCERPFGVSSYYGWRDLYGKADFHLGIDIPDDKGSYIWAADGGTVVFAGRTSSYGNNVHVIHSNGYSTLYAHLDEILVSVGDVLYKKQIVGTMGDTGVAYGTHLHFEVRINNATVDPIKYLPKN